MIDPRFYGTGAGVTAGEIADWIGAPEPSDPLRRVQSVASAPKARRTDLTFAEGRGADGVCPEAGICLVQSERAASLPAGIVAIHSRSPKADYGRIASRVVRTLELEPGAPAVHPSARLEDGVVLESGCIVGPGVVIGARSHIGAGTIIGPGVQIGRDVRLGYRVSIRCALIGNHVQIASGAVIGETGFGLAGDAASLALIPHFGRVILQDGVSVGANTTIDRGLFDDTVIGDHSHIDNLCHIGHNTVVGSRTVMAAFAGISGSVSVGSNVQMGGRVGIADHVDIGDNARLAAGSAVMRSVPAGETYGGHPAKPLAAWLRELAWVARAAQKRGS